MGKSARRKKQHKETKEIILSLGIKEEEYNKVLKEYTEVYGKKDAKAFTDAYYLDILKRAKEKVESEK